MSSSTNSGLMRFKIKSHLKENLMNRLMNRLGWGKMLVEWIPNSLRNAEDSAPDSADRTDTLVF
eukprot:COSAG02_NODE_1477_length_12419_cov_15.891396_8_plen_64_part_00